MNETKFICCFVFISLKQIQSRCTKIIHETPNRLEINAKTSLRLLIQERKLRKNGGITAMELVQKYGTNPIQRNEKRMCRRSKKGWI